MGTKEQAETFLDILVAGMNDAATNRKLTQLKTTITPTGRTKPEHVRIIIVPESMDMEWSKPLERLEE